MTSIGNVAFGYAHNLREINLPASLRNLGEYAFIDCYRLNMERLVIPEGVVTINEGCFESCTGLNGEIVLPSTLKNIAPLVFNMCRATKMDLPEHLETVGYSAFAGLRIKEACVPYGCKFYGELPYSCCFDLETLRLPEGMDSIPKNFAQHCVVLKEVNIPSTVKKIGRDAFYSCSSLEQLNLPAGLQSIGAGAFQYLNNLKSVRCEATVPPVCDAGSFATGTPSTIPVYIPKGTLDAYKNAPGWNYFTNFIEADDMEPSGIDAAVTDKAAADGPLFDLMGRKVQSPARGHIYIKGGKKVMY